MAVAVILLSVILIFFMALAAAVRGAVRELGLRRAPESEVPTEARSHIVILLGIYLRWLNVAFLLAIAVYLLTARASAWYYGVALVALCWIGSLLMGAMTRLHPDSAAMVALLTADLERRRDRYRAAHNTKYVSAVEDLLSRVRTAGRTHAAQGLRR